MKNAFNSFHELYTHRVNNVLEESIKSITPSLLKTAMSYSLLAGGKRIRPFLVYATGKMFDCQLDKLDIPAAAIEIIHTYSLIHDDLPAMDDDNLRRGMPTCHVQFDEATAILAGDALQTFAFSLLAQTPHLDANCKIDLINELSHASGSNGMCLGQSLDLQSEHCIISYDELKTIHSYKTGALIRAAVRLGMFVAGQKALEYQEQLSSFANHIGLAFQIQDDVLDEIGDVKTMGKEQGADKQLEKNTYISLLGLEKSIQITQQLYQQAIEELNKIPYNSNHLRQLAEFIINRRC